MKKENPFESKTLDELKAIIAKQQKMLAFLVGIMSVAFIAVIYTAIKTQNWSKLFTLGIIGTLVPSISYIKSIKTEIKKREGL